MGSSRTLEPATNKVTRVPRGPSAFRVGAGAPRVLPSLKFYILVDFLKRHSPKSFCRTRKTSHRQ